MPIPLISPLTTSGIGPTQLRLRNRLADQLGSWQAHVVATAATNPEAARTLLLGESRDDEAGYELEGGRWAYVRTGAQAGTQRRVLSQPEAGYQGPRGALVVSRPFDAALAVGAVVELTEPLPVKRHTGVKGLNDCLNEGLALCRTTARLTMTGTGAYEHDLADYPFLYDIAQVQGVLDTRWLASGMSPALSPYSAHLVRNGVTTTLVTPDYAYGTTETFYLDVLVPADVLVYDGAAWAFNTENPGLQGDDWQAAVPEHWAVTFAMVKALEYLHRRTLTRPDLESDTKKLLLTDLVDRRKKWSRAAWLIQQREFPRATQERTAPAFGYPVAAEWN